MLKFYNKNTCDEEEVWIRLERSGKFGWSWCKELEEPFRHTAIALYFDHIPRFTVNFRTEDGSSKAAAAFSEARPLITIERVVARGCQVKYYSAFEEFSLFRESGKRRAKDRIRSIISYQPGNYNLFINNCRDHVKGVVKHILGKDIPDAEFAVGMSEIQNEDTVRKVGAGTLAVFTAGVIAAGAAVLTAAFGSTEEEEEEVPA